MTFPFCSLNWINNMLYRRRRSKFSELVPNPFAERSCKKICSNQQALTREYTGYETRL